MTATLEDALRTRLEQSGGIVLESLLNDLRSDFSPEAPELATLDDLKQFIESKPDTFRVSTSVNGVERARLTNPRRVTRGLIPLVMQTLEEMSATDENSAASIDTLFAKAQEQKQAQLGEGEELPFDFASKSEFVTSVRNARGVRFAGGDSVYAVPRSANSRRGPRASRVGEEAENDGTAANEGGGSRRRRGPRNRDRGAKAEGAAPVYAEAGDAEQGENGQRRQRRPQGTPKEPKQVNMPSDANDSTFIAHLIYKKLCERGAVDIDVGLTTKMLLRLVSLEFKEARPESEATAMSSLRVFKQLLSQVPGLKRQRPRSAPGRRGPRPPLEIIVWLDSEDEVVAGIEAGLEDDLANADVTPDTLDNPEELANGAPQDMQLFEQESWNTKVVGPTGKEDVLQKFLQDHSEQQIWAVETEHRVGMRGRPTGPIAVIVLSDMKNTILWDVHEGGFPQCLVDFFQNEGLFKGGVRIGPKGSKLKKQFGVEPKMLAELSVIAHTLGLINDEQKERVSMRMMTQAVLNVPVSRPPAVRDSNWELRPLTKAQYKYAVEDGFATALLFMQMVASLHKSNQGHKLNECCVTVE